MKGQLLGCVLRKLQALFSAFGEGFVGGDGGVSFDQGGGVLSRAKRHACAKSAGEAASQAPCTYSCVS